MSWREKFKSKDLSDCVKNVVSEMMAGRATGEQAWANELKTLDHATLLRVSKEAQDPKWDPFTREMIAADMQRRVDAENATPLRVSITDFGAKGSSS